MDSHHILDLKGLGCSCKGSGDLKFSEVCHNYRWSKFSFCRFTPGRRQALRILTATIQTPHTVESIKVTARKKSETRSCVRVDSMMCSRVQIHPVGFDR